MPGLTLISGNRLEALADRCGTLFGEEPLPPMQKEVFVLQSLGMMQWLSIRLAERLGIWADFEYVLPNRMTGILMKSFFPGLGDERFFDKDIMTWKTMKLLMENRDNPVYSELYNYLRDDVSGIKGYQISSKITDLYDQYMTFRPDMIIEWDKGMKIPEGEWQPHLWRGLTSGMNGFHPPALLDRLFRGIADGSVTTPADLPRRISVFGVSYLPLYHLNVLRAAANFCDVYLYMLNPCMEYWVDLMREKEITALVMKKPIVADDFEEMLHIERGNTLLSSMGRAGRDFFRFLYMSENETGEEDIFEEPEGESLLEMIQSDILFMRERGENKPDPVFKFRDEAAASDRSLVINSCHSVMREVEVLHDYLLDLFNNNSGITPGDVLVMTPDIESFSSIIQGVFDRREESIPRIPYRIVDRSIGNTSRAVDTLIKILSITEGRFTSAEVMAILQCGDVLRKFDLTEDDFSSIGAWVRDTGIFWGIDSGHRAALELPALFENTWSFGLERMLLGSVMQSGGETVFDILPYPVIEGNNMQVLGRFITFFQLLRDIYYKLLEKHTPDEWGEIISGIAENFFETDSDSAEDMLQVTKGAVRLREIQFQSGFDGKTGLPPVKEFIEKSIAASSAGRNFITGNLTFCEMLPMRSIPCRVICLIGMNEYSFPRKSRPSGFDLMVKKPRIGDRSVRDEDRYLFLETVISAREMLYVSYTGQNITTNTDQNPSIVISEILDYIDQSYATESGKSLKEFIFKKQRIQAYHPVYFTKDSGYFSYSSGRRKGADSYTKSPGNDYIFFKEDLPALTDDERSITVDALAEFLVNPSRYLIKRRLGVNLENYSDDYTEVESFIPGSLERYNLDETIFGYLENGVSDDDIFKRVKAAGILLHGTAGKILYNESFKKADKLYKAVSPYLLNITHDDYDLEINGFRITGRGSLYDWKLLFHRAGALRPKDRLRAWLYHLASCSTGKHGPGFETLFITADESVRYKSVEGSAGILGSLLGIYESGMMKPAPLFPASSYRFALSINDKEEDAALHDAVKLYSGSWGRTDSGDPYIAKLFSDYQPDEEFIELSKTVYSPMMEHQCEVNDGEV